MKVAQLIVKVDVRKSQNWVTLCESGTTVIVCCETDPVYEVEQSREPTTVEQDDTVKVAELMSSL